MERRFRSEVESYRRLHSLQSHKIPRCYGSGTLILPNRAFFLLLQHISDAISLEDIAVKPDQSVLTSLAETAYAFGALGATHNDINLGNILFSPRTAPTHTIIIDFGEAYFREDDESDEEQDEILKGNWDVDAVRQVLVRKVGRREKSVIVYVRMHPPTLAYCSSISHSFSRTFRMSTLHDIQ
jgi:predicted Ser/Thr protein kinase